METPTPSPREETTENSVVASTDITQNPPDIAGLPDELILQIAHNLDSVDLFLFRDTNRKTRRIIEPTEPSNCMRWAIMVRLEQNIDVEKAEKLVCCACKTKHSRAKLLPSDTELPLDICKVNFKTEERICVDQATSTLFSYTDDLRDAGYRATELYSGPFISGLADLQEIFYAPHDAWRSRSTPGAEVLISPFLEFVCGHCRQSEWKCNCGRVHSDGRNEKRCNICPPTVTVQYYNYTNCLLDGSRRSNYAHKFILYEPEHRQSNPDAILLQVTWNGADGKDRALDHWRAAWHTIEVKHGPTLLDLWGAAWDMMESQYTERSLHNAGIWDCENLRPGEHMVIELN